MRTRHLAAILLTLALVITPATGSILAQQPGQEEDGSLETVVRGSVEAASQGSADLDAIAAQAFATQGTPGTLAGSNLETTQAPATPGYDATETDVAAVLTATSALEPSEVSASMDHVPTQLRESLIDVLSAFDEYRTSARDAFGEDAHQVAANDALASLEQAPGDPVEVDLPDLGSLMDARQGLVSAIQDLAVAYQQEGPADVQIDACPSVSIDLTDTDDTYTEDCALVIDAGGDDRYLNNAGGTQLGEAGCGVIDYEDHRFSAALIDLDGDDEFGSKDQPRDCGVNGGGWGGAGLLWDEAGQDRYYASDTATNGGALYGVGFLHDGGGDDVYAAGGYGVNGGSVGGVGLLNDEQGNDTYRGTSVAVNGGSYTGIGLLVDGDGDDAYEAGSKGANGGNVRGIGTLIDRAGDDTYRAVDTGVNGGSEVQITGFLSVVIPPSSGLGLLLDASGEDQYRDLEGGTGPDETVLVKGYVGAQVDLPHLPGDAQTRELDQEAPNATPHVVVGLPDNGVNPYHEQFHRPDLTEHPCTYIPGFPCDVEPLNLTLDADSREEAIEADAEVWDQVEPGQWYWIPQTSFVAVACAPGTSGACILNDGPFPDSHGTYMASSVVAENSQALLAYKDGGPSLDLFLNKGLPVDLYASSWAHDNVPKPLPANTCGARAEHEAVGLYVKSTHDLATYPTFADCWDGAPNVIDVGGALAEDKSTSATSPTQPEIVSYDCRPVADPTALNGTVDTHCGGGSSLAATYSHSHPGGPTAAGAISHVIQTVREETGYTGTVEDGSVDPLYGDDGLTIRELRDAVNRTASYNPEPKYDNSQGTSVPLNPAAPWLQWGWGFYDEWVADATIDHLLETEQPAKPLEAQVYMQAQETFQTAYYGGMD